MTYDNMIHMMTPPAPSLFRVKILACYKIKQKKRSYQFEVEKLHAIKKNKCLILEIHENYERLTLFTLFDEKAISKIT